MALSCATGTTGHINSVKAASRRVADMMAQILQALPSWSLSPVVDCLVALRGIDKLAAITLLAELGDISRFGNPKQLMAFLGLVPSEHSSGKRRRQGAITRTGNGHARCVFWRIRSPVLVDSDHLIAPTRRVA